MASSQDTEITLGTGKLLVLFFGLVAVCALFFALGYSLGRKAEPAVTTASAAVSPQPTSNSGKTSGGPAAAQPMKFYKAVEEKQAAHDLTPAADAKSDPAAQASPAAGQPASNAADPSTSLPTPGYFVQVAAVSKQDDADALVDALKKKEYPAFVAAQTTSDKLFRVQLGPYSDVKEAETMRAKLVGDGYSPILKK
ncbi:MAG TPA: SPOR domain-containing protein [Candidatus Sulfotelmatobacter sp.]|jgi:cell division septation protein DedD